MKKGTGVKEKKAVYGTETNVIKIPVTVFETVESKEELEDWLLVHNPEFIKRMKKARADDLAGKGKTLEEIKRKLCIK